MRGEVYRIHMLGLVFDALRENSFTTKKVLSKLMLQTNERNSAMAFETYLIDTIKQMDSFLLTAEVDPNKSPECLSGAAGAGCRTLKRLCDDKDLDATLDQFADVRIITTFIQRSSARSRRSERRRTLEFKSIIEDPTNFERFLELEREVLRKGGVPHDTIERILESCLEAIEEVRERAKPPSEIIDTVRTLRDRACQLSQDLTDKAVRESRWSDIRTRLKKVTLGAGGLALVGLNASALAASVGITAVGSVVSAAFGGAVLAGATADLGKSSGAAGAAGA